ncbi:sigma-70 family RNA polymerase sigma factor, partial [bacterium]
MKKRSLDSVEINALVKRAQSGETEGFDILLWRFQDMAVGYATTILRDRSAAEDAAQDAFVEAFRNLSALREPAAFPGWLRQIVWKHCDRQLRRNALTTVNLDEAAHTSAQEDSLEVAMETVEVRDKVMTLVGQLPNAQREVVVLFY